MGPFQDEPDEDQQPKRHKLFMDEPEESRPVFQSHQVRNPQRSAPARAGTGTPVLWGDEPDEHAAAHDPSSSSDDEGQTTPATLNVSWSAMEMFSKAKLMKEVALCGKPEVKKRPYDNSRRAQQASESAKPKHRTYKDNALDPTRLRILTTSSSCKCVLPEFSVTESLSSFAG